MSNIAEYLAAPFDPKKVSWRVGSTTKDKTKGMALAYIDARDVMERLDSVVGPANWQRRYTHADKKTICEIGIFIESTGGHEWVWKADGAGDSDIEAEKGAISDAFKRAAVNWGIGRYLYDVVSPWVELETYEAGGKVNVKGIKASEMPKLAKVLSGGAIEAPKTPNEDEKAHKALAFANAAAMVYREMIEPEERTAYIAANWPKLEACVKYPEAKRVLMDAGLV